MSKKSVPTQNQRYERARRQRIGIALIVRPLKFIKNSNVEELDYIMALDAAKAGEGAEVKSIARSFL